MNKPTIFGTALAILGLVPPAAASQESAPVWPLELTDGASVVTLHQPQIEAWEDYTWLDFRLAAVVQLTPDDQRIIGSVSGRLRTLINREERTVTVESIESLATQFPEVDENSPEAAARVESVLRESIQGSGVWSLDRVLGGLDGPRASGREYELRNDPPPIYYSESPAILVIFDGPPIFAPVSEGSGLQFALNTNWDVFRIEGEETLYILNEGHWLEGRAGEDGWAWTASLPTGMRDLPDDENFGEVRAAAAQPGIPADPVPVVYTTEGPAELIVVEGQPALQPADSTELLYVTNSNADLVFEVATQRWYLLVSGRWFTSADGKTGWEAQTGELPASFSGLDPEGELGHLLVAVPGTPQAELAVLEAEIPEQATVAREGTEPDVQWQGEPEFEPIEEVEVSRGVNTTSDVLYAEGRYYCVQDAVWFVSDAPTGPWIVCDTVPTVIYSIPPSSPSFHVTFVHSYWHSSTHVVFGYTWGYMGVYVGGGCIRWGTGWRYPPFFWRPPMWGPPRPPIYWGPRHYSFGFSAWYNPWTGGFVRGGRVYGPWGGIGRASFYNPRTGTFVRAGAAWGPRGGTWGAVAWNPRTGTAVGVRRSVGPYGSWGNTVVRRGGAVGRPVPDNRWRSMDRDAITDRRADRPSPDTRDRDLFAGRDGEVYRRDGDQWQRRDGNDWRSVEREARPETRDERPSPGDRQRPESRPERERPETRPERERPETREARPDTRDRRSESPQARPQQPAQPDRSRDLDRQLDNRQRGNQRQQDLQRQRSQPQSNRSQPPRTSRPSGSRRGRR